MRKLGILGLCALLFAGLAYALLHSVPPPTESSQQFATPASALGTPDQNDIAAPGFALKLDRTLGDGAAGSPPRAPVKQTRPGLSLLIPYFARLLALLVGAMLVGSFAAWSVLRPVAADPALSTLQTDDDEIKQYEREEQIDQDPILLRTPDANAADELLHSQNAAHAEELSAYKEQLNSRDIELDDASARIVLLEQSIDELREELEISEKRCHALNATQREQLERFEQQQHEVRNSFSSEIEEHTEAFERLQTEHEQLRNGLNSKNQEIATAQQELDSSNARSEYLEQQLTSALSDSKAQIALIEELQESKSTLVDRVVELEPQAALAVKRSEELDELNGNYQNLRDTYDELVSSFKALQADFEAAQERVHEADELDSQVTTLKGNVEQVATARDEYIAELGEMHTLFSQAQLKAAQADEFEERVNQLILDLASMTKSRDSSEEQVYTLNSELAQLIKQLESKETERSKLDSKATQTLKTLESRENELETSLQALAATKEQLTDEQETLAQLQQRHTVLEQEQTELKSQFSELNQEHDTLQSENTVFSESVELLREDLADMVRKIGDKNKQISDTQQQVIDHKRQIAAQQSEIESLLTTIEDEHEKAKALTQQVLEAEATEQRLATWDNTLETYRNDISSKNRLIDELRDGVSEAWDRSAAFKQQTQKLEEQLQVYTNVATELELTQTEVVELTKLIADQDALIAELSEQTKVHENQVNEYQVNIEQLDDERQHWQQELSFKANTAAELEAELLDQHETLMSMEELLDGSQVDLTHLGDIEAPSLESADQAHAQHDTDHPSSKLLNKGSLLIKQLHSAVSASASLINDKNELKARLSDSNNKIIQQHAQSEKQTQEFLGTEQQLRKQIETASIDHQNLVAELEDLREARDAISSQAEEQAEEQAAALSLLQEFLEQEQQNHKAAALKLSETEEALVDADSALQTTKSAVIEIETEKQRLTASLQSAEQEAQQNQLAYESAVQNLTETEHRKVQTDSKLHAAQEEAQQQQQAHESLVQKLAEIESTKTELDHELSASKDTAEQLQLALDSALQNLADAESAKSELDSELHTARDEAKQLKVARESTEQDLKDVQNTKSELDNELHIARDEAKQLRVAHESTEQDLKDVQNTKSDLESELRTAREDAQQLKTKHESALQELADAENVKTELDSELRSAQSAISSRGAEIDSLRASVNAALEEAQQHQLAHQSTLQKLLEAENAKIELDSELHAVQSMISSKKTENDALRTSVDTAMEQVEQEREARAHAEEELGKLETALADATRSTERKKVEFNELKAARDDALRQLAIQKDRVAATEQTLTAALAKQQNAADQLREELKAERAKTTQASEVPTLTQKVAAGTSASPTSIPVLGQPIAGGTPPPVEDELPVLNQPLGPRKS